MKCPLSKFVLVEGGDWFQEGGGTDFQEELNTVFAILLYKGHVKDLFIAVQASTQYQGDSSSHELASLPVTEHSKFRTKQPISLIILDARSAFDSVIVPYLIRNMFLSGMDPQSVVYMDHRLANCVTFCEFNKIFVGPIHSEQGGISPSDCYKLFNNEMFDLVQSSNLGADIGENLVLSAVGQADDTALLSNELFMLMLILRLVTDYCIKYNVQLSSSKTKLMEISPPRVKGRATYNPINFNGEAIGLANLKCKTLMSHNRARFF